MSLLRHSRITFPRAAAVVSSARHRPSKVHAAPTGTSADPERMRGMGAARPRMAEARIRMRCGRRGGGPATPVRTRPVKRRDDCADCPGATLVRMRGVVRAVTVLAAVLVTGCASGSGGAAVAGDPVLRATRPPWPAPRDGLAQIQAAGVEPSRLDDTTNQRRFTLTLNVDGQAVPLVPYIGMDRPRALQGPAHTHDDSGVVWLEGRGAGEVTLGQFFTLWGVRFTKQCLGATCGTITVRADGKAVAEPVGFRLATVTERVEITARAG